MAFRHDIGDAHYFKNCAHWSASNDASAFRSWRHHDVCSSPMTKHVVVNCSVFQRNFSHISPSFFHGLLNSSWHFLGFALAHANATVAITDNRQRCETEDSTTLNNFSHAIDRDHFFLQTIVWSVIL